MCILNAKYGLFSNEKNYFFIILFIMYNNTYRFDDNLFSQKYIL